MVTCESALYSLKKKNEMSRIYHILSLVVTEPVSLEYSHLFPAIITEEQDSPKVWKQQQQQQELYNDHHIFFSFILFWKSYTSVFCAGHHHYIKSVWMIPWKSTHVSPISV